MIAIHENFSYAHIAITLPEDHPYCASWIALPAENVWPTWIRIALYTFTLLYLFMGIAVASDIFMFSIERITAKKRKISLFDKELGVVVEDEVFVWNETVANLTLMALGSSAPEILLACIEAIKNITKPPAKAPDSLGLFTILGSAAFNLFGISGICILTIPSPMTKKVEKFGVFLFTSACSLFAYAWMLLTTVYISPQVVELWEAVLTLLFFPAMVFFAYAQDNGWWRNEENQQAECRNNKKKVADIDMKNVPTETAEPPNPNSLSTTASSVRERKMSQGIEKRMKTRSSEFIFGRHRTIHQSPFRFRQIAMSRLSRVNQYIRRMSYDFGSPSPGLQNYGRAFFSSTSYSVGAGARNVIVPVYFQRHPIAGETIIEDREGEESEKAIESEPTTGAEVNRIGPELENERRKSMSESGTHFSSGTFYIGFELRPGTARPGIDFQHIAGGIIRFGGEETEQMLTIELNPEAISQAPTEALDFYVVLRHCEPSEITSMTESAESAQQVQKVNVARLGIPSVTRISLKSTQVPDYFEMQASHFYADGAQSAVQITVLRLGCCAKAGQVGVMTRDGTAKARHDGNTSGEYEQVSSKVLEFEPGCRAKTLAIAVYPGKKNLNYFFAELFESGPDCRIGNHKEAICYLHPMGLGNLECSTIEADIGWAEQFRMAVNLLPGISEDGLQLPLTNMDYALHGLTFFWKLICAFIPPRKYLGAYPTFFSSLVLIGVLTALVEEFSNLLGCVAGLKTAVTGITLVALGTSLPDAFASRTAARLDHSADNSIGNITGSNSVNVFLGLGVPWLISAISAAWRGTQYCVATAGVYEGSVLFLGSAVICLGILLFRRWVYSGELGGPLCSKWVSGVFIILIWVAYVTILSLKSYGIIRWETKLPASSCLAKT